MTYLYARQKQSDARESTFSVISAHLSDLAARIAHEIAETTKAHLNSLKSNGTSVDATIIARAGDVLHHFNIELTLDDHLNVIGRLDYVSTTPHGQHERAKDYELKLPATAHPSHFVDQVVGAAREQFEGVASKPVVEMKTAAEAILVGAKWT